MDRYEKILSDYKLNFELENKSNFPSLNKLNNMDLNEKIKQRTQDDSDNEDESIVWGRERSRFSKESLSESIPLPNTNTNAFTSIQEPQLKKKKIYSKNIWHGDFGDNLQGKTYTASFPTLNNIYTSEPLNANDEEVIKYKHT